MDDRDDPSREVGRLARMDRAVVPRLQRVAHRVTPTRSMSSPTRTERRRRSRVLGGISGFGYRYRQGVALFAVLIIVGAASVRLVREQQFLDQAERDAIRAQEQTVRQPGTGGLGGDTLAGGAVATGPVRGTSVDNYLDAIDGDLTDLLPEESYTAVVSFDDFVSPERMSDALPAGVRAERVQYRLQLDGAGVGAASGDSSDLPVREAEVIGGDIPASISNIVDRLLDDIVTEEAELNSMLETTEEAAFIADFELRLEQLATLRSTLASGGRILFAAVVTGDGDVIQSLGGADGIRAIDLAPEGTDTDASEFFGLLPTDQDQITFGQFA